MYSWENLSILLMVWTGVDILISYSLFCKIYWEKVKKKVNSQREQKDGYLLSNNNLG